MRRMPHTISFGGVREIQIRTTRNILEGVLRTYSETLNEESSRPLTADILSDPKILQPITTTKFLTCTWLF